MTILKVTEAKSEEVAVRDEVVAGQVRMAADKSIVVLIVDAKNSPVELGEGCEYITVILSGIGLEFEINETYDGCSAEEVKTYYPILLDTELSYNE